jgi:glutamyl-tRNA synthetase
MRQVSDPVLIRADGQVLYTFASSVDDIDMGVTHIVRGADHVTNTATQIQIMQAMGGHARHLCPSQPADRGARRGTVQTPGHAELARPARGRGGAAGAAVADGAAGVVESRWNWPGRWTRLAAGFDIGSFGAAPTRFNPEDLRPLTRAHLQRLPLAAVAGQLAALGVPEGAQAAFWAVAKPEHRGSGRSGPLVGLCRDGAEPLIAPEDAEFIGAAMALLPARPWDTGTWGAWTTAVKDATGRKGKGLFMPLRRALTGMDHGPEMAQLMPLLQGVRGV